MCRDFDSPKEKQKTTRNLFWDIGFTHFMGREDVSQDYASLVQAIRLL